jgi:hypothetical protein
MDAIPQPATILIFTDPEASDLRSLHNLLHKLVITNWWKQNTTLERRMAQTWWSQTTLAKQTWS